MNSAIDCSVYTRIELCAIALGTIYTTTVRVEESSPRASTNTSGGYNRTSLVLSYHTRHANSPSVEFRPSAACCAVVAHINVNSRGEHAHSSRRAHVVGDVDEAVCFCHIGPVSWFP